jgi:hypothetical protein
MGTSAGLDKKEPIKNLIPLPAIELFFSERKPKTGDAKCTTVMN